MSKSQKKEVKLGNKVLVIALDGGTFDILKPLIEKNKLPTIKMIIKKGVHGKLSSIIPPISPTAWASFITGKNPGKHRVFSFFVRDDNTDRDVPVKSYLRKGKSIWDIIGEQRGKVIVLNVPTTYPPQQVNGILVSGFLTPKGKKDFIYPQFLVKEIEEKFGKYPLFTMTPSYSANLSIANFNRFMNELLEILSYKFKVAHYLLDNFDFNFFMLHIWGTDKIQHELWNLLDANHTQYDKNMSKKCRKRIFNYFSRIDSEICKLMERINKEVTVFIISDHGFGPINKLINLNTWLLREGYIKIKRNIFSMLRLLLLKLGLTPEFLFKSVFKRLLRLKWTIMPKSPYEAIRYQVENRNKFFLSLNDIDLLRSKAYSKVGSFGTIYINKQSKELARAVDPEKEYKNIRNEIAYKLSNLKDFENQKKIESQVFFKENLYKGKYIDDAPDIIFYTQESGYLAGSILGFGSNKVILNNLISSGHHRIDGIFMARGKNIISGKKIEAANLVDLAPTILYLLGLKIPKDMDGKLLKSIFTHSFLKKNKPRYIDDAMVMKDEHRSLTKEEETEIIKKLKELRYIT